MLRLNERRGVGRVEILVGGVFMALLVAWYILPSASIWHEQAKRQAASVQIDQFVQALEQYAEDNGAPPTTQQGLDALIHAPTEGPRAPRWRKRLDFKQIPLDPWGNTYHYECPGPNGHPFLVVSYGSPDGCQGLCEDGVVAITSETCLTERRK